MVVAHQEPQSLKQCIARVQHPFAASGAEFATEHYDDYPKTWWNEASQTGTIVASKWKVFRPLCESILSIIFPGTMLGISRKDSSIYPFGLGSVNTPF